MSFELFLQSFAGGRPSGIPVEAIRSAFGAALSEPEEDFWQVNYGPTQSSDLFLTPHPIDSSLIHIVSVDRPSSAAELYEAIWQLLEFPGTCLYFPGETAPLTRDPEMAGAMPPDMVEALGRPALVDGPAAIAAAVLGEL